MGKFRCLVVDDSKTVRKVICQILESHGYEVVMAEDGLDAIKKFDEDQKINFIITDINMPNISGMELVMKIRNMPGGRSEIPIVVVSTEFSEDIMARGKSFGVSAWVVKPFEEDEIKDVVQHFESI